MNAKQITHFDLWAMLVSVVSLSGTGYAARLSIPAIKPGFYGGTALIVFFIFLAQVAVLSLGVGVPAIVQAFRRRPGMNTAAILLITLAVAGLLLEIAALYFIPVTES